MRAFNPSVVKENSPPRGGTPTPRSSRSRAALGDFFNGFKAVMPGRPDGPRGGSKDNRQRLGNLEVSEIGVGTWSFGNKFLWGYEPSMDEELRRVFFEACDNGINFFDTGDSYGTGSLAGRSESLLGQFCEDYCSERGVGRDKIVVATKFAAYPWRVTPNSFVSAAKQSARRLRQDRVDVGQLHWSTANYQPLQEKAMWRGLEKIANESLAKEVGLSNYGPRQTLKIADYLKSNDVSLGSAQIQISLLSWGTLQRDVLDACKDLGILPIAYSPLALGMLTGRADPDNPRTFPQGPRGGLYRQVLPGAKPLLRTLEAVAEERGKTIPQVAVNWAICKGTMPIPGAKNVDQLRGHLGACGWRLSLGEVEELERAAASLPRGMVQNIFQTK